jgi:hypothetical protein
MLDLYRKVDYSVFKSTNIQNLVATISGTVDGKDFTVNYDNPETHSEIMSAVKGLFSTPETDSFLSALVFVEGLLLTKTDKKNPDKRIAMTEEEIKTLRFSYIQDKGKLGKDVRPAVSWEDILNRYHVAQVFDFTQTANRKPRQQDKNPIKLDW